MPNMRSVSIRQRGCTADRTSAIKCSALCSGTMAPSFTTALLLSALCCCWLSWLWSRRKYYKFGLQFPSVWGLPLLGVFLQVRSIDNLIPSLREFWKSTKQGTLYLWLSVTPLIVTVDPEVVEQVLTKIEFAEKSPVFYGPVREALKGGMVSLPGNENRRIRKIFAPTVRHTQLVSLMPIFNSKSKELLAVLEELCEAGGAHAVLNTLRSFSFIISKETTMGYTEHKQPQEVQIILKRLMSTFGHVFLEMILNCAHLRFLVRLNPILHWNRRKLYEFGNEIFSYRAKNIKLEQKQSNCFKTDDIKNESLIFIDQALKFHEAGQLSWQQIVGEANAFLIASVETTSFSVYSTLMLLAMHPPIQERLYEEIRAGFPSKDFEVQYADFENLPYLEMVINEALRLFPPAPMLARNVTAETSLHVGGRSYSVPQHMQIAIDVFHMHREPRLWGPQAHAFNPDHFLPHSEADRHAYAYLPFSKGSRNCLGWKYAYYLMKVFLTHVLRNYSVHTSYRYEDIKVKSTLFLEYVVEPRLRFQRRV